MSTISRAGSSRRRGHPGFSLVELLTVASIVGLMAGIAAMSIRSLRSPALNSAANEFASAVKMTRQMAISSGRKNYILIPIVSNALTTNVFRAYAIFEEIPPGEELPEPSAAGLTFTNNTASSWFLPRTDWRVLPEGVVFCNLSSASLNTINLDAFTGVSLGKKFRPTVGSASAGQEWRFFESYTNFDIRRSSDPSVSLALLSEVPFLAFYPNGRAFYNSPGNRQGAGVRLVPGFVQGNEIALTETNNFYVVETDAFVGRVRVRNRESYR